MVDQSELLKKIEELKNENLVLKNQILDYYKLNKDTSDIDQNIWSLINAQNQSIWSINNKYEFVIFNDYLKEQYSFVYHIELKVGLNALEILNKELFDFWKPKYDLALSGEKLNFEFKQIINGVDRYFDISLFPVFKNNEVIGASVISNDITSHKHLEQKLIKGEEKFKKLIEFSPVGMLILKKGIIKYANNVLAKTLGYESYIDLIGKPIIQFIHPDFIEIAKNRLSTLFSKVDSSVQTLEEKFIKKDGSTIDALVVGHSIIFEEELAVQGYIFDVSESKNLQRDLKSSEQKFKLLADYTNDWEYWIDPDGNYLYISPSCEQITGYRPEEFIENPNLTFDIIQHEYRDKVIQHFARKNCKTTNVIVMEFTILKKSGELVWLSHTCRAIFDESGNYMGRRGNNRDITIRKIAETKLKLTSDQLRIRNELSNAFILKKGNDYFHEVLQIILRELESKFGFYGFIDENGNLTSPSLTYDIWDKCEMENKSFIFPAEIWGGLWGESLKLKKTLLKNKSLKVPHGHIKIKNAIASPILYHGELIGQIAVGEKQTDYTESDAELLNSLCDYISPLMHARLQEKIFKDQIIQAKEKAEEADRLKSAFLANMSHEIRTPMNAIKGFAELLQKKEYEKEKLDIFLKIINQRADDLLNVVNDILDISKIESDQLELSISKVELDMLFGELYNFFFYRKEIIENKDVEFKRNCNLEYKDISLYTDQNRLKQIFINLIGNSLKFTKKGFVEFGCEKIENNLITFYVRDTGIGIQEDKQKIIFDRFRQSEDVLFGKEEGGVGLGLSIAKGLVELMNGKIWLKSEYGKGTTFYFDLPFKLTK